VMFSPGQSEPGGASRRSRLIAEGLAERGWRMRAITRAGSLRRFRLARRGNLTLLEIPGFSRRRLGGLLYLVIAVPLGLAAGVRARAFIALQLMSTATAAGLCGTLLRRPFLAMATTSGRLSEVDYLRSTRTWEVRRRLLGRAWRLLAQTPQSVGALSTLVPRERIAVLPNPVQPPWPAAPALTGLPRALYAGRLSAEKGLDTLLDAWRMIGAENPAARLIIAGSGGDHRSVEANVRARVAADDVLRRSVELPGWIDDLAPVMASADVFVLPSLEEGMSNALLEACAAGRVAIVSAIAPNRAVVGHDYPLTFEPGDSAELSKLLRSAFANEDGLAHHARDRVIAEAAKFAADAVLAELDGMIDAAGRARN